MIECADVNAYSAFYAFFLSINYRRIETVIILTQLYNFDRAGRDAYSAAITV